MSFLQVLIQLTVHQGASHLKLQPIKLWNVVFVVLQHVVVFRPVAELGPFLALASMLAGRNVLVWVVQVGLSLSQ